MTQSSKTPKGRYEKLCCKDKVYKLDFGDHEFIINLENHPVFKEWRRITEEQYLQSLYENNSSNQRH